MPYFVRSIFTYTRPPNSWNNEYVILDVDGDGDRDIVFAQLKVPLEDVGNPLTIMLNNGSGGFSDGTSLIFPQGAPQTVHPRGTAAGDFNGDGRLDLFIADQGLDALPIPGAQNNLLLSSGAHGFVGATDRLPQLRDFTHSTTAGDIDGDGDKDILVMNVTGGTPQSGPLTAPYFLINDGTGHFTRRDDLLPALVAARDPDNKYLSCLLFDADGDGAQDLFLGSHGANGPTNFSRILYNDGTGDFSDAISVNLPTGPWPPPTSTAVAVTAADLNGDGKLDLIVDFHGDNSQGHYFQLLINRGSAGFVDETPNLLPQSTVQEGPWVHSVQAVDLNGDGFVDMIARDLYTGIFLNDGTGHFIRLPASFLDAYDPFRTTNGTNIIGFDANGDGRTDLLVDYPDSKMAIFIQQDPGPSQTGTAIADALLGDLSDETLLGMGGDDVLFAAAGNDVLSGGAGADKMVGGFGADLFTDTAANLNGDTIADFARGDRIVITDAAAGASLGWNGSVLTYGTTSLTLTTLHNASITAGAAPGGGVQIVYGGPALIVSAGPSVGALATAESEASKTVAANSHFPIWSPDSATLSVETMQIRLADDMFALA